MGLWSKIKKTVSRTTRKAGLNKGHEAWVGAATGALTGVVSGALAGAAFGGVGAIPGAIIGGAAGGISGYAAGGEAENQNDAAKLAEENAKKAQEIASRTEAELTSNNTEETETGMLDDERRARLAASYSLSKTQSGSTSDSFRKKQSSSKAKKTIG